MASIRNRTEPLCDAFTRISAARAQGCMNWNIKLAYRGYTAMYPAGIEPTSPA